jgi:hypothetical protein
MWDFVSAFWPYLLIAAFFILVFTSLLTVGLLEKQRIRDFVPVPPESLPPASPYFKAMNDAARQLGYQPGEVVGQARNSRAYRCCLAFWLSADQKSLLCIGGGKLAVVDYKRTLVLSKLENGRILVTTDECGMEDFSGTRDLELLLNAHLPELHALHQRRLLAASSPAAAFAPTNLLGQYEALNEIRVRALIDRGLARFVDAQCDAYRFTVKGALLNATTGYIRGLKRGQAQKERVGLKRPGS